MRSNTLNLIEPYPNASCTLVASSIASKVERQSIHSGAPLFVSAANMTSAFHGSPCKVAEGYCAGHVVVCNSRVCLLNSAVACRMPRHYLHAAWLGSLFGYFQANLMSERTPDFAIGMPAVVANDYDNGALKLDSVYANEIRRYDVSL